MLKVIVEVFMRYAAVGLMGLVMWTGCSDGGGGAPSPTPQVSATPVGETLAVSPTPLVNPTPDGGTSPAVEETQSPTPQAETSATPKPTAELSPSENFSPTPGTDVSDSPTASVTPLETAAPTGTAAPAESPTDASPTVGVTPAVTPTATISDGTGTAQPTLGTTPTLPPTSAPTPTEAPTPTATPTEAPTPTVAPTPTATPTLAPTPTEPPTPTPPVDVDNDGFWAADDCDDTDASTYPGAPELCDGVDNNCDGGVDEGLPGTTTWYSDGDGDGFGDPDQTAQSCIPLEDYVDNSLDCNDNDPAIRPGSDPSCPVASCQEAVDLGLISTTAPVWIQPASEVVEVMCTFGNLPAVLGITSSEGVAHLTRTEIFTGCPAGLQPYRYLAASYVDEAIGYTAEENLADYYLLNSFAGPQIGCPALATRDGYLRPDGRWFDDELELSWWGLDISSNCNQDEFDPIPMASGVGPRSTSGDTFLYSASESGATYPVLCMEIYDRDGDGSDTTTDCDDTDPLVAPGKAEVLDLIDNNCDGVIDEGTPNTSCIAIHQANATLPSGTYNVDPDGTGPGAPFRVYCDMDYDGGGWTLVSQGIPVVNNSLSLCNTTAVGSLNLDGTTVTAPAKLADTTINSLWSSRREWLVTADVGSASPTRTSWPRACVVDFKSSFNFVGPITQNIALSDLDSTTLTCTGQAWGDAVINEPYGPAGLFCGYRYVDTSSGASGSNNAWYLLYSAVTTYAGGTCGTATAGRSWLSTGNWGCNVTKMWVR